jgi:hypothetical protein
MCRLEEKILSGLYCEDLYLKIIIELDAIKVSHYKYIYYYAITWSFNYYSHLLLDPWYNPERKLLIWFDPYNNTERTAIF